MNSSAFERSPSNIWGFLPMNLSDGRGACPCWAPPPTGGPLPGPPGGPPPDPPDPPGGPPPDPPDPPGPPDGPPPDPPGIPCCLPPPISSSGGGRPLNGSLGGPLPEGPPIRKSRTPPLRTCAFSLSVMVGIVTVAMDAMTSCDSASCVNCSMSSLGCTSISSGSLSSLSDSVRFCAFDGVPSSVSGSLYASVGFSGIGILRSRSSSAFRNACHEFSPMCQRTSTQQRWSKLNSTG